MNLKSKYVIGTLSTVGLILMTVACGSDKKNEARPKDSAPNSESPQKVGNSPSELANSGRSNLPLTRELQSKLDQEMAGWSQFSLTTPITNSGGRFVIFTMPGITSKDQKFYHLTSTLARSTKTGELFCNMAGFSELKNMNDVVDDDEYYRSLNSPTGMVTLEEVRVDTNDGNSELQVETVEKILQPGEAPKVLYKSIECAKPFSRSQSQMSSESILKGSVR